MSPVNLPLILPRTPVRGRIRGRMGGARPVQASHAATAGCRNLPTSFPEKRRRMEEDRERGERHGTGGTGAWSVRGSRADGGSARRDRSGASHRSGGHASSTSLASQRNRPAPRGRSPHGRSDRPARSPVNSPLNRPWTPRTRGEKTDWSASISGEPVPSGRPARRRVDRLYEPVSLEKRRGIVPCSHRTHSFVDVFLFPREYVIYSQWL